jgi:hypothetical protein
LARRFKAAGKKVRFRYAADAVRTRMYRNWTQLRDGWTKNLALLFPRPGWLATEILIVWGGAWLVLSWTFVGRRHWLWGSILILAFYFVLRRLVRSNFSVGKRFLAFVFGMPVFAYLLLRSKRAHAQGNVPWKGRTYSEKLAAGHGLN